MDLLTYVQDMAQRRSLALAVGKSADYLWQVGKGIKTPGAKLAQAIHDATGGIVRRSELRPDLWGRK